MRRAVSLRRSGATIGIAGGDVKRWPVRIVLTLSLLAFAASLWLWIDSYWHARRIGWAIHQEDRDEATITVYHLFNRRGQAEFIFERSRHDGVRLAEAREKQSYFSQDPGLVWESFPAHWMLFVFAPQRSSPSFSQKLGFSRSRAQSRFKAPSVPFVTTSKMGLPNWLIVLITGVVPIRWCVGSVRKRVRIRRGCCGVCGYDLRASIDRCPECGTAIPSASET